MEREITLDLIQAKELANRALQALVMQMEQQCETEGAMTLSVKVTFDYFALNEHETGAKPYEMEYIPDGYVVDGGKLNLISEQTEIEEAGA